MNPVEVLNKLNSLKTIKARQNLLRKLPEDHEFWYGASLAIRITEACFPYTSQALKDPEYHGRGVPPGVFQRIVEMHNANNTGFWTALAAFSKRCTEEQWQQWYKPILTGNLIIPLNINQFKEVVRNKNINVGQLKDLSFFPVEWRRDAIITPDAIEPYMDIPRALWFLGEDHVVAWTPDGQRVWHPLMEKARGIYDRIRTNLIFDIYMESEEILIIRDVFSPNYLFHGNGQPGNVRTRIEVCEDMAGMMNDIGMLGVEAIERYDLSNFSDWRENAQVFIEQGYKGFVFTERGYPRAILTKPTKKNVLTCVDITSGKDRYENKVEYIHARGVSGGKKFTTRVYYGLNWEQRDTYFRDKDRLIGRRFEVLSCGLSTDGRIILPVFQQWRE